MHRFLLFLLGPLLLSSCVLSPSGGLYVKAKPEGAEYTETGVVSGVWRYDFNENLERLEELLPFTQREKAEVLADRYQVRVQVAYIPGIYSKATELVILPEGWTYTTSDEPQEGNVVNLGDVIDMSARKNRLVDYLISIRRKCAESPADDERGEWDVGCFSIDGYSWKGYAGKLAIFLP